MVVYVFRRSLGMLEEDGRSKCGKMVGVGKCVGDVTQPDSKLGHDLQCLAFSTFNSEEMQALRK